MHFTQISIRIIFKENNKSQWRNGPSALRKQVNTHPGQSGGQPWCAEEMGSSVSEAALAVLPPVSRALHILKWHLEIQTGTLEPIIKGKRDLDYLEVNPEIIFTWTCKNDIGMHVSVHKTAAAPASLHAECALLQINILMGFWGSRSNPDMHRKPRLFKPKYGIWLCEV